MSHDELFELAPLAALGALDPGLQRDLEEHASGCPGCARELASFAPVLAGLALALPSLRPRTGLRGRLLGSLPSPAVPMARSRLWPAIPVAATLLLALLLGVQQRTARSQSSQAEAEIRELASLLGEERQRTARLRLEFLEADRLGQLLARPEARLVSLGGQPAAPDARARVLFHPETREAILLVSGLAAAPAGQTYEVWVIAGAGPVAAGTFQADAAGQARVRLPVLTETAQVQTFAVTLEPEGGRPAPSGPLVLAGTVS